MAVRSKQVDLDKQFAEGVKRARLQAKMTQEQLTQAMVDRGFGFYQATMYKVESGARRVTVGEAIALAQILGTSVESLAGTGPDSIDAPGMTLDERRALVDLVRDRQARLDVVTTARREAELQAARAVDRAASLRAEESAARAELLDVTLRVGSNGEHQAEA